MKIIRSLPALRSLPFQLTQFLRVTACCALALQLSFIPFLSAAPANESAAAKTAPAKGSADPILTVMQTELARATSSLAKGDPAPYFLSYTVNDQSIVVLVGAYGSLLTDAGPPTRARRRGGVGGGGGVVGW